MACPASRDGRAYVEADRDRVAGAASVAGARVCGYTGWREGVTAWQLGLAGGAPDRPGSRTAVTEV